MSGRPILKLLRQADARWKRATLPPEVYRRIAQELARASERRAARGGSLLGWWVLTAAIAVCMVVLIGQHGTRERALPGTAAVESTTPAPARGVKPIPVEVEGESCELDRVAVETHLRGACRARSPAWTLASSEDATLVARGTTIVVRGGEVTLEVEKVRAGEEPVRVEVSHGVIEVLGTRFTVRQGSTVGTVKLFEGRIRFVHPNGNTTEITPGQTYAWGGSVDTDDEDVQILDDDPEPAFEDEIVIAEETEGHGREGSKRGRKRKAGPSVEEAAKFIAIIEDLKARRDYAAAAKRLAEAQHRRWDSRSAQILSYELGTLLAGPLGRVDAACKQFARHERRFPRGRYHAVVQAQQTRLGCAKK